MRAEEIGARALLARHDADLGMFSPGVMNLFLDPTGTVLDPNLVSEASPGGMAGKVEYIMPTPGQGCFVHLAVRSASTTMDARVARLVEINGEGWQIIAREIDLGRGLTMTWEIAPFEVTARGSTFLLQFAPTRQPDWPT